MNYIIKKFLFLFFFIGSLYSSAQISVVSPRNNQIFNTNKPVLIKWNSLNYNTNYKIQISNDPAFATIITNITTVNSSFTTMFTQTGTYYFRVKSVNEVSWSDVINIKLIDINAVTGLQSWFSADSLILAPGGLVNSWTDIKNNARSASQPTAVNQPVLSNISELNNKPGITFNGNDVNPSYLDFNIPITSVAYSIYMLRNLKPGNTAAQYVFGSGPSAGGAGFYAEQAGANQGPGVFLPFYGNNFANEPVRNYNYCLYLHTKDAIFRNNNLISAFSNSNITNPDIRRIGIRFDVLAYAFKGTISEFLYFDKTLDSASNNTVYQYFAGKYAPPVSLGFDTILGTSFCDSVIISTPNSYVSYLWSNGKTTQAIKVLPNKSYSVDVTDIFGQTSSDDILVYPYKRLGNKTVVICQGNTVSVDLKTPPSFTILWSDNSSNKIKTFNVSGTYTVKITDQVGCSIFDTINIVVDIPKLSITPVAGNITMCEGEKLYVNSFSTFDSIRWSTGASTDVITITTPGNYSVYARTAIGCIFNQSFNINIAGKAPVANFSYASLCEKTAIVFTDLSVPPTGININNWKWNFSNGITSTQQSPTNTFSSTGIFSAALKITTTQGCSDSIFKTFTVNKIPKAQFTNRKSCEGNPTTFEDKSVPNAASITNWKWDFAGLGVINDIQNPAFAFPTANTYNVNLQVTNSNGCKDTVTNQVKVDQSPIADFSFDEVCGRSPVNFRFLASVPPAPNPPQPTIATWQWDFGDNTFNSSIKDVSHPYDATGTYTVKLTVTSSEQCPNSIEKQVKVYEYPVVDFDISATQCAGKDIQFTDLSQTPDGTPMTSWKWYFSGQSTDTMQNTSYAFATEGNYTIQLTAANAVGCTGTKLRSVAVSGLPVPKFTFSPQNGLPPLIVNYTNQSPANGNYIWDYGDGSALVSGYNPPTHTYNIKGTYPIKLIATNFRGCTDTLTKQILVDKAFIDGVMTSITIIPNGDYYQIQATILNASNIEIRDLGLNLQLGGGAVIRENWTGSLLPGQSTVYNFIGQINIGENGIPVICSTIDNVNNNSPEDVTTNNTTCKEVRVGSFDVLNIYPNPAYEVINFGIMLPKDGRVTIGFIDILGQTMFKKDYDGVRGYNNFTLSTAQLNAAVYVAVVNFDNQIIRKKIMRRDRK